MKQLVYFVQFHVRVTQSRHQQYLELRSQHFPTRFGVEVAAKLSIPTSVKKYG